MAPYQRKDSYDLLALPLLWTPYALLTYRLRFLSDDAFISFRYARNWANGHGVRFNLGDHAPVEGYSNFLWVAMCAAIEKIGANVLFWAPVISFACGSILLVMVYLVMRRRLELNPAVSCLATLLLGCSPAFAIWSTSGLETMPFALLFFTTFYLLVLRRGGAAPLMAAGFGIALSLIRVEGIYWAILFAPLMVVSRRLAGQEWRRSAITYLLVLIAGYGAYWLWRYSYYHLPFSGGTYAKVAFKFEVMLRGLRYVVVQWLTLLTPLMGYVGIAAALRKERVAVGLAVATIAVAVPCWAIVMGGDFMAMGRFLVAGLAFNVILFGWLIQGWWDRGAARKVVAVAVAAALVIAGLAAAWNKHLVPRKVIHSLYFRYVIDQRRTEYEYWLHMKGNALRWGQAGKALKEYASPGDSYWVGAIGAKAYYSDLFIFDYCGLVTSVVIESGIWRLGTPGHDRCIKDFDFILDQRPTYLWADVVAESALREDVSKLKKHQRSGRYVVDFKNLTPGAGPGKRQYLLVWRIIEEGAAVEAAWDRAYAKLERELDPEIR